MTPAGERVWGLGLAQEFTLRLSRRSKEVVSTATGNPSFGGPTTLGRSDWQKNCFGIPNIGKSTGLGDGCADGKALGFGLAKSIP